MMHGPANTLKMAFQKALVVFILHGSYSEEHFTLPVTKL
jgi:hypothetical protein